MVSNTATRYQWRKGFSAPVDAAVVAAALERIRKRTGNEGTQAAELVEEASNPSSPLHPCFEWNDSAAAAAHRVNQARALVRNVVVVEYRSPAQPPKVVQAYASVPNADGVKRYTAMSAILDDEEKKWAMLTEARTQLLGWCRRYEALAELAGLADAVKQAVAAFDSAHREVA